MNADKKNYSHDKKKEKIQFPICIPDGYYARNYNEYKFDKMLREHAKENGKEAMYDYIRDQNLRNYLRRIDTKLNVLINVEATTVDDTCFSKDLSEVAKDEPTT